MHVYILLKINFDQIGQTFGSFAAPFTFYQVPFHFEYSCNVKPDTTNCNGIKNDK